MAIKLSFQKKDLYLTAQISGKWESSDLRKAFESIKEIAENTGYTRILVDAFDVSRPEKEFQRYVLGEDLADLFPVRFMIAILYKPELTNRFAENTAVNRGARVRVCDNETDALEWLLGGLSDKSD